MQVLHDVSLADYSTMRLGGTAAHLVHISSRDELAEAISWASAQKLPIIMIGGGSNIVWRDEGYAGLVIVNEIPGYLAQTVDDSVEVTLGAGENWDAAVARTVNDGLTGIEGLSLIPGSCGATPVQNVGAYGQEIAQTLVSLDAYDTSLNDFVTLPAADCDFGYRSSRFKVTDRDRFFITSITLRLHHGNPEPPFYPALQYYFTDQAITQITPAVMRKAVIAIRSSKLPDPAVIANNGSFFANPIVSQQQLEQVQAIADSGATVPHWPTQEGLVKIAAAWLVDQAGFRGVHDVETGMATWEHQALVLVNEHAQSTSDLLTFKSKIVAAVEAKFGITLEQEPELLPVQVA